MPSVIILCDDASTPPKRLIELLKEAGIEARPMDLDGLADDEEAAARRLPVSVLCTADGIQHKDSRPVAMHIGHRAQSLRPIFIALLSGHIDLSAPFPGNLLRIELPEPPKEIGLEKIIRSFKMDTLDIEIFQCEKPCWPKPKAIKPKAGWKHRPAASHPARSRDKRFMR